MSACCALIQKLEVRLFSGVRVTSGETVFRACIGRILVPSDESSQLTVFPPHPNGSLPADAPPAGSTVDTMEAD